MKVHVYDSLYPSVSIATINLIASLIFSTASQLVVRMMDVGRQSNGSDCGVLTIAFAYDACSGSDPCKVKFDPCKVKFDHKSIRQHLTTCLEKCSLSRFPVVGEWRNTGVKHTQTVDRHCSCHMPRKEVIRWLSVMYAKRGITNTVWTFPVMFLVIQKSLGSVNHALVCDEPVSVSVNSRCGQMYILAHIPLSICFM